MMASHHHDALWAKLHELEVQLAAYKLLRAARCGEDAGAPGAAGTTPGSSACRGRQYDAYMRRRNARRVAAASAEQQLQLQRAAKARQLRAARAAPVSPRALRCAQEAGAATPRLATAQAKRTPAAVSIPSTPRRDAAALPRSKTVTGGGAAGSPARPSHHQRRNSLGALAEFGECATPRPFLKRGTGTGGAAAPARLRTPRVHDIPAIDVTSSTPRPPPQEPAYAHAPRHARSVSELPLEAAALASPQAQARARKRWGSPERPAAIFSAASAGDSHRDLSKGLRKLLSFVRKGGGRSGGAGDQQPFPAPSPRGGGKSVSKGWAGCSPVDVPMGDRASLEGHRLPMTRAVGISG
ncbi:hypothetical protein PAHAL_2G276400 [Panicum hallii]|uniref:Uncharacterized protein n=1 Tax=Panicum hallii TaxID=206008 RepID=A0A2T8KQN5_9POAL|nr:uncharacterized protein LOC112882749 [Panicum hallii]PVH64466.1 hypothetical protein PAHAL_2G276400 [Panicum hallii]